MTKKNEFSTRWLVGRVIDTMSWPTHSSWGDVTECVDRDHVWAVINLQRLGWYGIEFQYREWPREWIAEWMFHCAYSGPERCTAHYLAAGLIDAWLRERNK